MLKRWLALLAVVVGLVVSPAVLQAQNSCILVVGCVVTPKGSKCYEMLVCGGAGG